MSLCQKYDKFNPNLINWGPISQVLYFIIPIFHDHVN